MSLWAEAASSSWGPVQMRVSWCQRLDGRMLSTFSMMKLRGANSVLRNCRRTNMKDSFRSMCRNSVALSSGGGGGQIKVAPGFVAREKGPRVCAPSSPPAWIHPGLKSYHHASLFLQQRALQSQRCVFEVCVWASERDPSLHTDLTVITCQSQFSLSTTSQASRASHHKVSSSLVAEKVHVCDMRVLHH